MAGMGQGRQNRRERIMNTEEKKVITSGSLPDAVADMFAAVLVEFILQEEQEEKRGKEKSA